LFFIFILLGIQRGHQNTLEVYPEFLLMLGLGSIKYPVISSIGGVIWLIGRIVFFQV
jgi:glutathione S-transferase